MTLLRRYFQIRDDYTNLVSEQVIWPSSIVGYIQFPARESTNGGLSAQYKKTKGFAEDPDEGKYSFILIHALNNASYKDETLLQIR